jgi:SAM-dependent methyltransferase
MQFSFGKNWQSFSNSSLSQERILRARKAFHDLFDGIELRGKRFIDIGFGQGLSLLFAIESGAEAFGIDNDMENSSALETTRTIMNCAQIPVVQIVSILDSAFVRRHEHQFDIVHSWGVLHHTGDMTKAIENACALVSDNGYFICSIYNKHWTSPIWKRIKWMYNVLPSPFQRVIIGVLYPIIYCAKWLATGKSPTIMERGMDFFHNVVDWVGGYPYEYATMKEIMDLVCRQGLHCIRGFSAKVPTGCNEFVFRR